MGVVYGEVVCDAGDGRVHLATTELFGSDDFTSGSLDEGGTSEEDVALFLDNDALVGHGGDVGSSGGARAHDDGYLGDALRAHAGLVVEDAAEVVGVGEDISLTGQVGASRVDHVDAGELVFLRNGLGAQMLLDGDGEVASALDGAVVGDNNAGDALDDTDTSNDAAGGHFGFRVEIVAGHGGQLEEGGSRVDEGRDTVSGQHLVAGEMLLAGLFGPSELDLLGEVLHAGHDGGHLLFVFFEFLRGRVDVGLDS